MNHTPRANRFAMDLPLRYRSDGEDVWSYGITLNISASGVLFRATRALDRSTPMEMQVVLPGDSFGGARILSRGAVIRYVRPDDSTGQHVVAVSIDTYDLVHTGAPDAVANTI